MILNSKRYQKQSLFMLSVLGICFVFLSGCGGGRSADESAKSGQARGNMMKAGLKGSGPNGAMTNEDMKKAMSGK